MTRSALFFLNLIVPVLLVALAVFVLRSRRVRSDVARPWALAVFLAALWSTHLASYYLSDVVQNGARDVVTAELLWRNAAVYVLTAFALAVLWTTMRYMRIAPRLGWMTMVTGGVLLAVALTLDPAWEFVGPSATAPVAEIGGQSLSMFDLWAAVWGGSYLLPLLMGWILTQQTFRRLPSSLYRNQVAYWSLALALLLIAGPLALLQDPGRSLWQFLAALFIGGTAVTATISMVQRRLPNLRLTLRQGLRAFILGLAFFALSWAALWFATETPTGRELLNSPDGLLLAALIATIVFLLVRQLLGRLTRLLLLRLPDLPQMPLQQVEWRGSLFEPQALGELVLDDVRRQLRVEDAWLLVAEEGPAGQLLLRPLVAADGQWPEAGRFGQESIFIRRLRHQQTVARTDLTALPEYDRLDAAERQRLDAWERDLYAPFVLDGELVAVLALARRISGEVYDDSDRLWLRTLSTRVTPVLRQAQNSAQLHALSTHVFGENEDLVRRRRQQEALLALYRRGLRLLKPELHQQLDAIDHKWRALYVTIPSEAEIDEETLGEPLAAAKEKVNDLLVAYGRIEKHGPFAPVPIQVSDLVRDVAENLSTMARARRVEIHTAVAEGLPEVCGDADLLREAIHQLTHNAVKFNKIGGRVDLSCAVEGDMIRLTVSDDGVGIPTERLEQIWAIEDSSRLGLAITRYIVEAHDGRYEAGSDYGAGSTFSLFFPIAGI